MTDLVRYILVTCGVLYLISFSTIFGMIRVAIARRGYWRAVFIYCPACCGFWLGCALGALGYWPHVAPQWLAIAEAALATMTIGVFLGASIDSPYEIEKDMLGFDT